MSEHVAVVAADGAAVMTPVDEYLAARAIREKEEAARIDAVKACGIVPAVCGDRIPEAPARGAFRVFEPVQFYPSGEKDYEAKPAGFEGRKAMQMADAFDVMAASAARKKRAAPFSPGQMAMGRHYRDLIERYESAGVRCSSVEAIRSGGSGQGGEFIDAVLRDREEIERLRRRIGNGVAMEVRRVRPSKRGTRGAISNRVLADMVCLHDKTLSDVLKKHHWSVNGDTVKAVTRALAGVLDAMAGPVRRGQILVL
ncbi:hypothetical protein [Leisingera sp. M523]|uniref:hypothetical protein n=1 Tax=Leisingera sp. M523 TaxID=2867013 RepID=UPI0021A851AD|nr:hypothetical protein [Leisingera sp. M523]